MLKLCFYVPESHLETVKTAVFKVGAGKIGNYEHCCWQVKGVGQFRPVEGSQPFIGQKNDLEQLEEYRVELVLDETIKEDVLAALHQTHPYETPAFDLMAIETS